MTNPQGYVNPIGQGLKPSRIDMGVDYTGSGPLYAMAAGTITNVYNSGWPGGKFIGLKMDTGQYMYYAENINPKVSVGQRVSAGQEIGTAVGSYPYIEVGWAEPPGTGNTMAAASGQAATGGDPGAKSTAYGVSMSNLIASLGGPSGIVTPGGITGTVAGGYPGGSTPVDSTTASGSTIPGCVPFIWVIWYAILYTQKRRRIISCGWSKRQSPHEKRHQGRRGGTSATTPWYRRWHHIAS
jgi:Peptidase family M23